MNDWRDATPEQRQAEIRRLAQEGRPRRDPSEDDDTTDYRQEDDATFRQGLARYGVAPRNRRPLG